MKNSHNWSAERARYVNMETDQRKHTSRNPKKKGRLRVQCEQLGCGAIVLNLRDHIRAKHPLLVSKKKTNSIKAASFYGDRKEESVEKTQEEDINENSKESIYDILHNIAEGLTTLPFEEVAENDRQELPETLTKLLEDFRMWLSNNTLNNNSLFFLITFQYTN